MKVLHVVNTADAQSIPLELALAIRQRHPETVIASYYAHGDHPADHAEGSVLSLGAEGPFDRAAIARLKRLIRSERPDILHMHHAVSAFWGACFACACRPRPILIKTEHNDHRFLPRHQLAINAVLYPFLARIVCNSDTTLASLNRLERILAGRRAIRIYNGVDIARVRRSAGAGRASGDPFVVGNIGRLVPQKNQRRLIAGLAAARAMSGCDIRLDIVGHGPLLDDLRRAAEADGVASAVNFSGAMTRDRVYERLSGWNAFIMASNFEGFCNALVEAMAAGLPVAVSDIDTLNEVAGPDAIRFDHTSPEAIGGALVALSDMPRTDGGFAERYDIAIAVDKHLALYSELAE